MKTALAILLAVAASMGNNYAIYMQKTAVDRLPRVKIRLSRGVVKAFLSNKRWVASFGIIFLAGFLYAGAIGIAPISVVQPIMASGVALVAYLAIKNLGEKPRRNDLVAIGMSILGVVLIGISLAQGLPEKTTYNATLLWTCAGIITSLAIVVPLTGLRRATAQQAPALGISAGLLAGLGAVFAKLLITDWSNQWSTRGLGVVFSSVYLIAFLVTLPLSFGILQAALQKGMAVIVVPIWSSLQQVVPILLGMLALNERLPGNPGLAALRITGFAVILVATVILSRRAEEVGEGSSSMAEVMVD